MNYRISKPYHPKDPLSHIETPAALKRPACPKCKSDRYLLMYDISQIPSTPKIADDLEKGRLVLDYTYIVDDEWEYDWDCVRCQVKFALDYGIPEPKEIADVEIWTARIYLGSAWQKAEPKKVQQAITKYVEDGGNTVVGAYSQDKQTFTMLLWPETRPGYEQTSVRDCEAALSDLAEIFASSRVVRGIVPEDMVHCMMGLRIGGYDAENDDASLSYLDEYRDLLDIEPAYMISARQTKDKGVQSYGEPVAILTGTYKSVSTIHAIGYKLKQHHYAIEDNASERTFFYETKWAA